MINNFTVVLGNVQPAGPAGPAGERGDSGNAGRPGTDGSPGLTWRGTWSSAVTYNKNDGVSKGGASYICKAQNLNQDPASATSYWDQLAGKGADGAGTGDMTKAVYDADNDGVVDHAASVPYTGVTGRPATGATGLAILAAANVAAVDAILGLAALAFKAQILFTDIASGVLATAGEIMSATASRLMDVATMWSSLQPVTLTWATTTTLDFNAFVNGKITLGGATTFDVANAKKGQGGTIEIYPSGFTAVFTSGKFAFTGSAPTLTGTRCIIAYKVLEDGRVWWNQSAGITTP